jgi:hypothetical protein
VTDHASSGTFQVGFPAVWANLRPPPTSEEAFLNLQNG